MPCFTRSTSLSIGNYQCQKFICIMVTCTLTCGKVTSVLDPPLNIKWLPTPQQFDLSLSSLIICTVELKFIFDCHVAVKHTLRKVTEEQQWLAANKTVSSGSSPLLQEHQREGFLKNSRCQKEACSFSLNELHSRIVFQLKVSEMCMLIIFSVYLFGFVMLSRVLKG